METSQVLSLLFLIVNIALLEVSLSLDNAAVISLLVKHLPPAQREKARYYGLVGAMLFRGLSLFVVTWIVQFWYLKLIGGLYLLWLGYKGLTPEVDSVEEGNINHSWLDRKIGPFWGAVLSVELVDILFSLDNLIAVVSMSTVFWIIFIGVFIGIVAMRFASKIFSYLLDKFPAIEKMAYVVIIILGLKIGFSGIVHGFDMTNIGVILDSHEVDFGFSVLILLLFAIPVVFSKYFNKPETNE